MILKRQRQTLTNLYIDVKGTQASKPPYEFTNSICITIQR
jgi:uncharacterized OsmC-like protein